jgi:predicted small integral membrane protein
MDMETLVVLGQAVLVSLLAGWLGLGALENIRAPKVNFDLVVEVLTMARVSTLYPDIYQQVGRNRIDDPRLHKVLFGVIVAGECLVAVTLAGGAVALFGALGGWADVETARQIAIAGVIGFIALWGAFLVGGQWFHYWAGSEWAQAAHFFLVLCGIGTLIFLTRS